MSRRMPDAERMRLSRALRRTAGLVRVEVTVPAEYAKQFRDLAHALRTQRQIDQPFSPEDDAP